MAFGINRMELAEWKQKVREGKIAFLTHYWLDPRFPDMKSVTKVGCSNIQRLAEWGEAYGLQREWIHYRSLYPHFDLIGERQKRILLQEGLLFHLERFKMEI